MGYGRALLQKDVRSEEASLRKKAKKKGLWGSIGRTIGSLGAMAISAGTLNPVTLGLVSGGASFLGGAIGAKAAGGKLTGGKFFKEERADLQRELGGFGSKNIVEALKGGVTAGIGQAAKLYGAGTKAAEAGATAEEVSAIRKGVGFGESFKGSMVGKGLQKAKTARLAKEYAGKGWIDPNLQGSVVEGGAPIVAMDRRTISPDKQQILASGGIADRFGLDKSKIISGKTVSPMATDLTPSSEFLSTGDVAYSKGTQFHSKNVFGVGDKAGEVIPISEATPRALKYGDQTVTGTYGSRETGEYFAEDTPKVSAWDKFKDFVDVSDVVEERDLMSQIESVRPGPLPQFTASNQRWTPPGTGYRRTFNQLSKEYPGLRQSGLSSVIK